MLRHLFLATFALLLTACASVEHKTLEARQKIKHDLNLAEVVDTSIMSFCWSQIGGYARCKYTPGIGILTPESLLLVNYENGTYVQKDILTKEDVKCISDGNGQTFTVFKNQLAVSLIPYADGPGAANNPEFRAKALKLLQSKGQPYLTGEAAAFIRKTDSKEYGISNVHVGGKAVPFVVGTDVHEIYSPCPSLGKAAR
ncbi:hypothetical protein NVV94_18215 [Pseudomonas sp. LS1212]|uniref:hypothetical protein n=1 Tax=Pseudomonas sp. LS1212 TaxID=2972478 RepID=UPI00215D2536|nr:hypothetical protein [Pseudomonas sp. LS1212]UVJ42547.1 hypothetical protein NVV94_18215 [Pseudomonas sp. LS1212]